MNFDAVEEFNYGSGTNIVGVLQGTDLFHEQVLVSAHYDSVPNCSGADDNATGVAGVLEVARTISESGEVNRSE